MAFDDKIEDEFEDEFDEETPCPHGIPYSEPCGTCCDEIEPLLERMRGLRENPTAYIMAHFDMETGRYDDESTAPSERKGKER